MNWHMRKKWGVEHIFIGIAVFVGAVMLFVMLYTIWITNRMTPMEKQKAGYKEWVHHGQTSL